MSKSPQNMGLIFMNMNVISRLLQTEKNQAKLDQKNQFKKIGLNGKIGKGGWEAEIHKTEEI